MIFQTLLSLAFGPESALAAGTILPGSSAVYNTGTGALNCTTHAIISKSITNNGQDKTSLLSFTFDDTLRNRTCQLGLNLTSANNASTPGSKQLQLYKSLRPSLACSGSNITRSSWPTGNQRGTHIATFDLLTNSSSILQAVSAAQFVEETPCPANQTFTYELVGIGDEVTVEFETLVEGLVMNYL